MHREDIYKWNNSHRPPAEDLRYPKAQERSLYNHIGPKKKKKKENEEEMKQDRTCTPGRELKVRRGSYI